MKMTEKRYVVKGNWIEDRYIGKLLNIDFDTITDAVLCCDLLNDIENKKAEYGKIASKYLEENEQLKQQIGYLIRELKTEMETSISRNERIRLDFAITVLESLKR